MTVIDILRMLVYNASIKRKVFFMVSLSISEYEILSLLWSEDRGLTAGEINTLSPEKSWKDLSIHLILTNMLEKGAIVVDGMVRSGRTYSRVFNAAITPEEYSLMQVTQNASATKNKSAVIMGLFSALIDGDDINSEDIDKIEALILRKKKER